MGKSEENIAGTKGVSGGLHLERELIDIRIWQTAIRLEWRIQIFGKYKLNERLLSDTLGDIIVYRCAIL